MPLHTDDEKLKLTAVGSEVSSAIDHAETIICIHACTLCNHNNAANKLVTMHQLQLSIANVNYSMNKIK